MASITASGLPMTIGELFAQRCFYQLAEQWHVLQGSASGLQAGGLEIQSVRGGHGCFG